MLKKLSLALLGTLPSLETIADTEAFSWDGVSTEAVSWLSKVIEPKEYNDGKTGYPIHGSLRDAIKSINGTYRPWSEEEIKEFENDLGFKIDSDLHRFLATVGDIKSSRLHTLEKKGILSFHKVLVAKGLEKTRIPMVAAAFEKDGKNVGQLVLTHCVKTKNTLVMVFGEIGENYDYSKHYDKTPWGINTSLPSVILMTMGFKRVSDR